MTQSNITLSDAIVAPRSSDTYLLEQQTFLGASIRSISANGGFGDTSSTLSVDLVCDEYNRGDQTGIGVGQDVYHNGIKDVFIPPPAGSAVFFTLGQTRQKVSDVFKRAYDIYYDTNTVTRTSPYYNHFYFGGILQSYVETKSPQGNPLYSVQVVDPREILSNVTLILNNFNGSSYGQYNLINVYGYLEFNDGNFEDNKTHNNVIKAGNLSIDSSSFSGSEAYAGNDIRGIATGFESAVEEDDRNNIYGFRFRRDDTQRLSYYGLASSSITPLTGTGFSRRSENGIPYYRICHAINALFGHYGELSANMESAGFFEGINFRGLNYLIDLSDLPPIPPFHYFDFDQLNLLDFCLEVCDISNRDLFVTLLPVINHPAVSHIDANQIDGIIKIKTIDRSEPFNLSSIKNFIDSIDTEIYGVTASDVGYELTNNVTDRVVVGANEVDIHYVDGRFDRNFDIESNASWKLTSTLSDNIIPYYGTLHNKAFTVPAGVGSYQQVLLDATGLAANGVGKYYVATEMELRAALIKYETWVEFLMQYNDIYMEPIVNGDIKKPGSTADYKVTVPRCVFPPLDAENGFNGETPINPCNPPLGYPLYWKRATNIGIPQAGLVGSASFNMKIIDITAAIKNSDKNNIQNIVDTALEQLLSMDVSRLTSGEKQFYDEIKNALINGTNISVIDEISKNAHNLVSKAQSQVKSNMRNTMKIYSFLKSIADECLGKKFLVKIDQDINTSFSRGNYPFGFPGKKILSDPNTIDTIYPDGSQALEVNKNPFSKKFEYNYTPEPLGGYPPYLIGLDNLRNAGLIPQDLSVLTLENSRISPYVIFSESQYLDFGSISSDQYTQQTKQDGHISVDYAYNMDNSTSSSANVLNVLNNPEDNTLPNSTAFLKCSLDSNFYMPPKITKNTVKSYYGDYNVSNVKRKPRQFTDHKTGKQKIFKLADISYHSPSQAVVGSLNMDYMDLNYLDVGGEAILEEFKFETDYVYALITLPGRISSTVAKRYRDCKELSDKGLKHFLQLDVTPIFDQPEPARAGSAKTAIYGSEGVAATREFDKAVQKSTSNITYAFPNQVLMSAGSPVFPDIAAIPLASKQRCYGPWMSSYRIEDIIGGNLEFIKDENLAPWNYAGYSLMNNAGLLRAEFGSSAQLTSERGSVTIAGPPMGGVALGAALLNGGPLVSTVNIDVSDRGITTVYKMDLFTASFGKLHKQKEKVISKVSRNQQKLIDERNALIRKNLGKNATNQTYTQIYKDMANQARSQSYEKADSSQALAGKAPASKFVLSVTSFNETSVDGDVDQKLHYDSSVMDLDTARVGSETLSMNPDNESRQYYNTVSCDLQDFMTPASMEPDHPSMSSAFAANPYIKQQFYDNLLPEQAIQTSWKH